MMYANGGGKSVFHSSDHGNVADECGKQCQSQCYGAYITGGHYLLSPQLPVLRVALPVYVITYNTGKAEGGQQVRTYVQKINPDINPVMNVRRKTKHQPAGKWLVWLLVPLLA